MSKKITILYERLSREDSRADESLSIENQKKILETHAVQNGFVPFLHISDDGASGANFNRPGWQELIAKIENDEVSTILIKTMDRMGRDYLRAGLYREMFKERGVRLIAVGDGYDSDLGEDDFTPFREIIAEFYARDTSRKIKAVAHAKGKEGKPLSYNAIYGYRKSPDDKNVWLIDDEAAAVVQRIFRMAADGYGPYQIAKTLCTEKVEKPSAYFARTKGWTMDGKNAEPYAWNGGTVTNILAKPEYCGDTVNFRTRKESFKSKKFKYNPKEDWLIFEDTHPALIDRETFATVQRLRGTPRRPDRCGEPNPLTGILFCAQCRAKMYNSRQSKTHYTEHRFGKEYQHKIADFYTCSTNSLAKGVFTDKCTQHYIRTEVVRELVLEAIKSVCGYVRENEAEFFAKVRELSTIRADEAAKASKKKLAANQRRIAELDRLFKKVYEDNANAKLSDKRFEQLSSEYEREQSELEAENAMLQSEVTAFEQDGARADRFIEIVRKYTEFEELTSAMLLEFISRILVHEADKSSGERVQEVEIEFNFIGRFEPPSEPPAPPTAEELAEEEKRRERRAKQREANKRWYAKKKVETSAT
jgi:DNA invertase Pin-like site-specific DNA recombinase